MSATIRRNWQTLWGLGYVALFLYLFLLRPAPEQVLRAEIAVDAAPRTVAAMMENDGPCGQAGAVNLVEYCPFKTQFLRWIAGKPFSVASFLASKEELRVWSENLEDRVALKVEMRWQARGGLLGKALDTLLTRAARESALAESLRSFKNAAEERRLHRAALNPAM